MLDAKLRTLLKVVEKGNYTKAAKALGLTQPAVSQHIKSLEEDLHIKMFDRLGNQLTLSHEGEYVLEYARAMLSLEKNLRTTLADEASGTMSLNIGVTHTVESNRISEVFAKYATSHPGVSIKLITGTQSNLKTKLKNYELDFAIIDGKITDSHLHSMQLDMDSLMLIVSPTHSLVRKNIVTVNDIKHEKLILRLPDSGTQNLFVASLESQNMSIDEFDVILEVDNIATIKDLIRHEYGVSVLAKSACMDETKKKKLVALPVENLSMIREVNIVYGEHFKHPELLQEFARIYDEI